MKRQIKMLCVIFSICMLLSACGNSQGNTERTVSFGSKVFDEESLVGQYYYHYIPIQPEHDEDYVIEWVDAGMEAHIRFLLNKPEGDIYHSDVWNVQVLELQSGIDVFLKDVPEGADAFTYDSVLVNHAVKIDTKEQDFPVIRRLEDLRHFDSLQILAVSGGPEVYKDEQVLDLQPLTECTELKFLNILDYRISSLSPLRELAKLERIIFIGCGDIDLAPLENHPAISVVRLYRCTLASVEPLATMPALRGVTLSSDTIYPCLEPLTRSTVEYLDLGLTYDGRKMYKDLDYESLLRIPNLKLLELTNHTYVDAALCEQLVANCENLKYLRINYTGAAEEYSKGEATLDTSSLEAFDCAPKR